MNIVHYAEEKSAGREGETSLNGNWAYVYFRRQALSLNLKQGPAYSWSSLIAVTTLFTGPSWTLL